MSVSDNAGNGPHDSSDRIRLRPIRRDDLPQLFQFQLDPDANRMAFTHPRSADEFDAHWQRTLACQNAVVRAIVAGGDFVGCISCFEDEGRNSIGYWIGREFWCRGIATRALALLLDEVSIRPLHARVADTNIASLRVLMKSGFEIVGYETTPGDDRYIECKEAVLKLM